MNDFDYDYGADYYSEAYGETAASVARMEDYIAECEAAEADQDGGAE